MLSITRPSWEQLDDFVSGCQTTLFICAPWVSRVGLERLRTILLRKNPPLREVAIWSRLADADTDAAGILGLAKALAPSTNIELGDSPCLHAKVYVAVHAVAMFGSANLTQAGFQDNLELLARTADRQEVKSVLIFLESIRPSITSVSLNQLDHFVTQQLPLLPPEPLATTKPGLRPIWEQDSLLPVVAEPKQDAAPEAPDRLTQTAGVFLDPMQLVRDARDKLASSQDDLQWLDLDSMVGERLKLILYPVGDTFAPDSGSFGQHIRSSRVIDLGEAEQRFQPRPLPGLQWNTNQPCHEIHLGPMQNGSLDFDDRADRNRTQTVQIEDTAQHVIGLRHDVLLGRRVAGLQRQP